MNGIPPTDGMAPPREPVILTRKALAEAKRKREHEGYLFPLELTGGYARVRLPSLMDRAFFDQLPSSLQQIISQQLADETPAGRKAKAEDVAAMSDDERLRHFTNLIEAQDELAQRMMAMCWIEPRVVLTEDELPDGDDGVILASDVHPEDRTRFVNVISIATNNGEKEAAREIDRFRREQVEPVPAQPALQAAPASIGDPEPAGAVLP